MDNIINIIIFIIVLFGAIQLISMLVYWNIKKDIDLSIQNGIKEHCKNCPYHNFTERKDS